VIQIDTKPIKFTLPSNRCNKLFETIKSQNGLIFNLEYHQKRLNRTFQELFNKKSDINLSKILKPTINLHKIKVIYSSSGIEDISYYIYKAKSIKSIKLVEIGDFEYNFKFTNRELFNKLSQVYPNIDEFILLKNGFLTDTTIANIALKSKEDNIWYTPTKPLLNGTYREKLLDLSKIKQKRIHYKDLINYSNLATLNAMVGFNILKV